MPALFYPSFQSLNLADPIMEEIASQEPGFIGRLGSAWQWRLAGGTLVVFRLDYTVTPERWDIIRGQASNPRAGLFNAIDLPFALYTTALASPPYIHEIQGVAEWSNRLYFNMGFLISEAVLWLRHLAAAVIAPHVAPPASFPIISSLERELVRYAIDDLDGRFDLSRILSAFDGRISRRRISQLAQEWESLGLLTARPRRVTYALRALIEAEA